MIIIPATLRFRDRWLLYVMSDGRKIPFNPKTLWPANSTEAAASFDYVRECLENARAYSNVGPRAEGLHFDGFGFQLGDGIACVDLDHCRDAETGGIKSGASEVIARLNSFTEVSRSGQGVHIFCQTQRPPTRGCRKGQIEIYTEKRWIAVTGDHLTGTPTDLADRSEELLALHRDIFGAPQPPAELVCAPTVNSALTNEHLLGLARTATNGQRFRELFDGPIPPGDHSRQDYELICKLLFWFGPDLERVDRVFRQSALMRPKWLRADYRIRTMRNAAARVTEWYTPSVEKGVAVGAGA